MSTRLDRNARFRTRRTTFAAALVVSCTTLGCGGAPHPRAFETAPLRPGMRVALLPLANYTQNREAPDKVAPMLLAELGHRGGLHLVEPGRVEAVLAREPWLMFDRVPPDLVERFGNELGVDALLMGSVLGYGYRQSEGERIPHVSIALRLVSTPGGTVLWSAVHSRDGTDNEWLFGFGRVHSLEQLLARSVAEITQTLPVVAIDEERLEPTDELPSRESPNDDARERTERKTP